MKTFFYFLLITLAGCGGSVAGPEGPEGTQGPQGIPGPAGANGSNGINGTNGTNGLNGEAGATGAQGATGPQGLQGEAGATGARGLQGIPGEAGAIGEAGPRGLTGAQGPAGEAGATGAQGSAGEAGATGPQGEAGTTGPTGPQGPTGEAGATGAQGSTGEAGATGPQGLAGEAGPQGLQGEAGATGPQGPPLGCVPGEQINCGCSGEGDIGVQTCEPSGESYGLCSCPLGFIVPDSGVTDSDPPDTQVCIGTLSNIEAGNFQVTFSIVTTMTGQGAIINQRAACGGGNFWDIRLSCGDPDGSLGCIPGALMAETDDGAGNYMSMVSSIAVNDGLLHNIIVSRSAGELSIIVDDYVTGTMQSLTNFGTLSPVQIGTDPCDGIDGTSVLTGTVNNVCVQ